MSTQNKTADSKQATHSTMPASFDNKKSASEGYALSPPSFQMKVANSSNENTSSVGGSISPPPFQLKAGDGNMPNEVRGKMEGAFQTDFSNVNVHQNSTSATDVGALAYTQGNDVHFAPGQFKPDTTAGQELIGHELTHVVQQREGRVQPTTEVKGMPVNDNKGLENEADNMGKQASQFKASNTSNREIVPKQNATNTSISQMKTPDLRRKHRKNTIYTEQSGPIAASSGAEGEHAIAPKDINQGAVGDCYFLASLASLAQQNPSAIENAITGPDSDGWYQVTLYTKQGGFLGMGRSLQPKTVKVWPSFPTQNGNNIYAKGGDTDTEGNEELWVKIIEKAYAQINGGYDGIHGGDEQNALEALTGHSYSNHSITGGFWSSAPSNSDISSAIIKSLDAGNPVTVSTRPQDDIEELSSTEVTFAADNGIIGRHVYAVMTANKEGITLRNPHGKGANKKLPNGTRVGVPAEFTITWAQYKKYFKEYTTRD